MAGAVKPHLPALHVQAAATLARMETAERDVDEIVGRLRSRGLRMTPQRLAIVSEVLRSTGHISPTAVARTVQREMPGVNASTVYRTLSLLEEAGVLQHSHLESGAEYHRAEDAKHVHLICRNCGREDSLSIREERTLKSQIRAGHGFEADLTHFAITGLCRDCAASTA